MSLDSENDRHHDLLQGSFKDTYRNLTYKHVMILKWALYYCPGVRYVLKSDDHILVNTPVLLRTLAQVVHYSTVGLWHFKTRNQVACLLPNPHANKLHSACSRWHLYVPIWLCTRLVNHIPVAKHHAGKTNFLWIYVQFQKFRNQVFPSPVEL